MLLGHCCLPVLSSPSAPAACEVVALLIVEFVAIALPDAQREWPVVSMLLGVAQYDASALLHRWLRAVGVRPSESPARVQRAFPALFPACTQPGSFHALLVSCMLAQEALHVLRTWKTSHLARASALVDQWML